MPAAAHRLSLLGRVTATLDSAGVAYALIGAAALAVHGVGRATRDIDLLTLADAPLDSAWWKPLTDAGVEVSAARGDADDPLAGIIRFEQPGEQPVDLVVGRHRWQQRILERAEPASAGGTRLPAARAQDLVLLKLFAGGAQDAWDIEQLLAGPDRATLIAGVTADLDDLPPRCRTLWHRIVEGGPD